VLLYSQGEFNNWYFGLFSGGAGVTFNSGSPVAIPNGFSISSCVTVNVSDSVGNLLFASNGNLIYNRNKQVMPNCTGLHSANTGFNEPIVAVQKLDDDSSYYVFTVGNINLVPYGLLYTIVNMRLDGGLGDIEPSYFNIPIPGAETAWQAVTGTRHQNNRDIWVVTTLSSLDSIHYAAYLINNAGINTPPVISQSFGNGTMSPPVPPYKVSPTSIKISPDGTKLVGLYQSKNEFCSFNSSTGQVTRLFFINSSMPIGQGSIEFSIDSKYLYLSIMSSSLNAIFQYDATKTDSVQFMQSEILIDSGHSRSYLQMGPDWRIYGSETFKDSLCIIRNPSNYGTGCNYQSNAIGLTGSCADGLPQFVQRYKAYIHQNSLCQNNPIHFSGDVWPPADSTHWDFGDPASGGSNYSNIPNPTHIYQNTGTYTVKLFVRHNDNRTDTSWQTITIVSSPQVALGADRTICAGNSTAFDAGFCTGCSYEWKDITSGLTVGTNQTYTTNIAGNYCVSVTNSSGCIGRDTVQLFTTPVPSVTNNPLYDSICSGETTNIPLTSNPTGAIFHWTATLTSGTITGFSADSGLVINQILVNTGTTSGIVTYHITPKIGSCIGSTIDFPVTVVVGDSVKVSITASGNNVCSGTSITYNAFPINPGLTPTYQWKVNGINFGTNSTIFNYAPMNNDVVTCELTSSLTVCISNNPATSNWITMVVNPNLPVSVTVTPTQNPVCEGTTVNFTALPLHEGTTPIYQWKVNGIGVGANLSTYSYIPLNGDMITCKVNSNATCAVNNPATSPAVTMTVNPNQLVIVSITSSSNPFCAGNSVAFIATPGNGGSPPSYQWKVNGIGVGTNNPVYSYFPNNGDVVTCVLNSNIACPIGNPATSNSIMMIVNANLPAGVSITATPNPFCPGSSVTLTATPSNGGGLPSYQWKVNGINVGISSNAYSYNPTNGDSVRCIMTSNLACVTGNPASSNKIIMSGTLTPIVTFTSCFDTITTINAKPIKLKGGIPLGGTFSGPGVNSLTSMFTPSAAGTGIKTIMYSYTNAALCSASKSRNIIVQNTPAFTCGNNLTDIRDNKVYPSIQIGSQCWLASNLNFGTTIVSSQDQRDNCISEKYCYNDIPSNCTNQGGLYQWDELMLFDETPADQGFCPPGWHIPAENDWNILFASYINNGFAGSPLKYSGYSGFNALLLGARHINQGWDFQGFATFFWSSTPLGSMKAWAHGMNDPNPSVSSYPSSRVNAFSVRCIRD
jgi:uncharacterized protein (TIGR02145 family)